MHFILQYLHIDYENWKKNVALKICIENTVSRKASEQYLLYFVNQDNNSNHY